MAPTKPLAVMYDASGGRHRPDEVDAVADPDADAAVAPVVVGPNSSCATSPAALRATASEASGGLARRPMPHPAGATGRHQMGPIASAAWDASADGVGGGGALSDDAVARAAAAPEVEGPSGIPLPAAIIKALTSRGMMLLRKREEAAVRATGGGDTDEADDAVAVVAEDDGRAFMAPDTLSPSGSDALCIRWNSEPDAPARPAAGTVARLLAIISASLGIAAAAAVTMPLLGTVWSGSSVSSATFRLPRMSVRGVRGGWRVTP